MLMRIQAFGALIFFIFLIVVAYKMGQVAQPSTSYDISYDIVKGKDVVPRAKKTSVDGRKMYAYVPAYSHVYISEGKSLALAVTLSLRNVDVSNTIHIEKVSYFNTKGDLIRNYLPRGHELSALETKEIFIKRSDIEGGSGANFMIYYTIDTNTESPIFETVMSGESDDQSYIFTSRGEKYFQK